MKRLGLICSSGGAVFSAAIDLLRSCGYSPNVVVVTDRDCGAETESVRLGLKWVRVEDSSRYGFSRKAAHWLFDENGVDWTCLFFSRLVTPEIYSRRPCVNIHPSILPAFTGFGAVKKAFDRQSRFIGATAHFVDESIDGGRIVGQVTAPILANASLSLLERLSFSQKLYIFLVLMEMAELGQLSKTDCRAKPDEDFPVLPWASPALRDNQLAREFDNYIRKENIEWVR